MHREKFDLPVRLLKIEITPEYIRKLVLPPACTDPEAAGDMLLPTFSKGTPEIDDGIYDYMKKLWDEECRKKDGTYINLVMNDGAKERK